MYIPNVVIYVCSLDIRYLKYLNARMDKQIRHTLDLVGRTALKTKLGVSDKALVAACSRGIPASWFLVLDELSKDKGVLIPRSLFNWKRAQPAPDQRHLFHASSD